MLTVRREYKDKIGNKVLDDACVSLLCYTPEPEKVVAAAAKLCYSNSEIQDLYDGLTEENCVKFLQKLTDMGHESPFEHAYFTFGIENVSRSLLAQLTRHRIASYSVQSQRYVNLDKDFDFVVPPEIEGSPEAAYLFKKSMLQAGENYSNLTSILRDRLEEEFLADGLSETEAKKKAEKKAIEDARFVLPNACTTKIIVTMNARSLKNFFRVRCCTRSQWEIRKVAESMLSLVREVAPNLFLDAGPACVSGICPEGKMSCGKSKEMREMYSNL